MPPFPTYRPEVRIVLRHGWDITPLLGDVGSSVLMKKSLYAPMGEFALSFPDMPAPGLRRESLYGLVEPFDPIEIWVKRITPETITWLPMLRGFVRSVGRDENVGGDGRVQRRVVLSGHDCGTVFLAEQLRAWISWLFGPLGPGVTPAFSFLTEYGLTASPMPAADFIWEVAQKTTAAIMGTAGWEFSRVSSVDDGWVLPDIALSSEGAVWSFLSMYADRPWNELFVREGVSGPELVYRPTPWRDSGGAWLSGAAPDVSWWTVPREDVLRLSAHRDESELVQVSVVTSAHLTTQINSAMLQDKIDLPNAATRDKFGSRMQQLPTYQGPAMGPTGHPEAEQATANEAYYEWVLRRAEWANRANADIHLLERGELTIKGHTGVRVGDYVRVDRGPLVWEGYIVGVEHSLRPFHSYTTKLSYVRGTQYLRRLGLPAPWDQERGAS